MSVGIEETVTKENIVRLKEAVINGAFTYPGALSICRDGNTTNQSPDNWKELNTPNTKAEKQERK